MSPAVSGITASIALTGLPKVSKLSCETNKAPVNNGYILFSFFISFYLLLEFKKIRQYQG